MGSIGINRNIIRRLKNRNYNIYRIFYYIVYITVFCDPRVRRLSSIIINVKVSINIFHNTGECILISIYGYMNINILQTYVYLMFLQTFFQVFLADSVLDMII